eukprot:4822872-Pyramimonas_sp.AAC.1
MNNGQPQSVVVSWAGRLVEGEGLHKHVTTTRSTPGGHVGGFAEVEVAWQAVRKGVAAVRFRGRSLVYEVSQTLLLAVHPPDLRLPLVPAFVPAHPTEAAPPLRPLRGRCECYFCSPLRFLHLVSPRVVTGAVA